jgi:alkylation response protein AidB-like acyl-CoA dehydrogenase
MSDGNSAYPAARASARRASELIGSARDLVPVIDRAGARIERERRLPADILEQLYDARLFRLTIPRSGDGEEVEPTTLFQVVEALAQGDASVAWCVGQANGVGTASAYLAPHVRDAIFGPRNAVVASGPNNRKATAVACDGGYRVTGNFRFASGSPHATWLGAHCTVCERDGTPRVDRDGKLVDQITVLLPKSSAVITDVWNVMGLKGTGSNDYALNDLFVPADHTYTRESDADRRESGPLYRFSIFNLFGVSFSGVALGLARRALDDFITLARTKTPYAGTMPLRDNGVIQSQVGLSEMRLRSARTFVLEHFRSMHALAAEGKPFTQEMRVTNRTVTCFAIQQARDVMNFVYHAAGATAIFEDQAFERRFRDLNTVTQQGQAAFSNFEGMGQTLLGLTAGRQT